MPPLVLASASARRRALLAQLGLQFEVVDSGAESECSAGGDPCECAERAATAKALSVSRRRPDAVVLAADTLVWLDGEAMGKPADEHEAGEMLRRLSGRTHVVHTGVAIAGPAGSQRLPSVACVDTAVRFRELSDDSIARYLATGEPLDKAGAYAIQGRGAVLVESIRGCYYNVVGLPLSKVAQMLQEHGIRAL